MFDKIFGIHGKVLAGAGLAVLAALSLAISWGFSWKATAARVTGELTALKVITVEILTVTRTESENPKLALKDVPEQIRLIGASRKAWKGTADLQSSRIDAMAAESGRLKALNADLRKRAEAAIERRDRAIWKLENMAKTPGDRANCAKEMFEAEAALDLVYREGL